LEFMLIVWVGGGARRGGGGGGGGGGRGGGGGGGGGGVLVFTLKTTGSRIILPLFFITLMLWFQNTIERAGVRACARVNNMYIRIKTVIRNPMFNHTAQHGIL
jgi:hypothetical protein